MKTMSDDRSRHPARARRATLDPETVAIEALGVLAADPERLDRFLTLTGLHPDGLRTAASDPDFVTAVLSYVASDETVLVALAYATGRHPEALGQLVRAVAEGGAHREG